MSLQSNFINFSLLLTTSRLVSRILNSLFNSIFFMSLYTGPVWTIRLISSFKILARMALLVDQSRAVFPLRSAKAQKYGELVVAEKCTCVPWTFAFKMARTGSLSADQNGQ